MCRHDAPRLTLLLLSVFLCFGAATASSSVQAQPVGQMPPPEQAPEWELVQAPEWLVDELRAAGREPETNEILACGWGTEPQEWGDDWSFSESARFVRPNLPYPYVIYFVAKTTRKLKSTWKFDGPEYVHRKKFKSKGPHNGGSYWMWWMRSKEPKGNGTHSFEVSISRIKGSCTSSAKVR